ncbi:VanW family protein [Fictibacillus nanhaiensis]|uniref:VanW family protein n=1 Tax=Fictibacillus nanhaiensis TaxID=742169 RepID=UPI003C1CE15B
MAKREFNPKNFLAIFASLSLAALFLFFLSHLGTKVYSNFFEEDRYREGVVLASIPLEGVVKSEAISFVNDQVSKWQSEHPVYLVYNDKKVKLSPEAWQFQNEESLKSITGTSSSMVVNLNEEAVTASLEQLDVSGLQELLDEEMLYAHLKKMGSTLQTTNLEVPVNEFLTTFGQAEEIVSESTIKLPSENVLLEEYVEGLEEYEIKPGEVFSLIGAIESVSLTPQDSIDLNVLASGIYTAIQKTNFTIIERHTSRELPNYASLGYEAFVKPEDMDLAFKNPNASTYKLNFVLEGSQLTTSIVGVPLPFTYTVKVDKKVYEPKTIIHFTDQLASIFSSVTVNSGSEGYLATVYRKSFGSGGEEVASEKLAEDFYPPKHRIEERGYLIEEEETSETTPETEYPVVPYPYPFPYPYPWNPDPANPNPYVPVLPGIPGTDPSDKPIPQMPTPGTGKGKEKETTTEPEKESDGDVQ